MQEINQYLAMRVKQLRQDKGWSLDQAAKETGVSKAMLGQIERGESSPTVARLWKIAGGFQCSLSSLLEPPPATHQHTLLRHADMLRRQPAAGEMLVAPLFTFDPAMGFELFELTLPPGYEHISEPHEAGVTEHIVVIQGRMELWLNGQWRPLLHGDAMRFAADCEHGYRNVSDEPVLFHDLIHYA